MTKSMTKSDLQTGDIIERRDGRRMLVIANALITIGVIDGEEVLGEGILSQYDDDLHYKYHDNSADIMKVRKSSDSFKTFVLSALKEVLADTYIRPFSWDWIREEVREVTMAEVEAKFGCKVKIIKE